MAQSVLKQLDLFQFYECPGETEARGSCFLGLGNSVRILLTRELSMGSLLPPVLRKIGNAYML